MDLRDIRIQKYRWQPRLFNHITHLRAEGKIKFKALLSWQALGLAMTQRLIITKLLLFGAHRSLSRPQILASICSSLAVSVVVLLAVKSTTGGEAVCIGDDVKTLENYTAENSMLILPKLASKCAECVGAHRNGGLINIAAQCTTSNQRTVASYAWVMLGTYLLSHMVSVCSRKLFPFVEEFTRCRRRRAALHPSLEDVPVGVYTIHALWDCLFLTLGICTRGA